MYAHAHLESFHWGFEVYTLPAQNSPLLSRHPSKSSTHFPQTQTCDLRISQKHNNSHAHTISTSKYGSNKPQLFTLKSAIAATTPHIYLLQNPPCASQQQNAPPPASAPQPGTSSALHILTTPVPKKIICLARTLIFALWRRKRVRVGGILILFVGRRRLGLYVLLSYFPISPYLPSDPSIWALEFRFIFLQGAGLRNVLLIDLLAIVWERGEMANQEGHETFLRGSGWDGGDEEGERWVLEGRMVETAFVWGGDRS